MATTSISTSCLSASVLTSGLNIRHLNHFWFCPRLYFQIPIFPLFHFTTWYQPLAFHFSKSSVTIRILRVAHNYQYKTSWNAMYYVIGLTGTDIWQGNKLVSHKRYIDIHPILTWEIHKNPDNGLAYFLQYKQPTPWVLSTELNPHSESGCTG